MWIHSCWFCQKILLNSVLTVAMPVTLVLRFDFAIILLFGIIWALCSYYINWIITYARGVPNSMGWIMLTINMVICVTVISMWIKMVVWPFRILIYLSIGGDCWLYQWCWLPLDGVFLWYCTLHCTLCSDWGDLSKSMAISAMSCRTWDMVVHFFTLDSAILLHSLLCQRPVKIWHD